MCFGGDSNNQGYLYGQPNYGVGGPSNINEAPSFRDIRVGNFDFANPGQLDLSHTNPELYAQIQSMKKYQSGIGGLESEAQNRAYQQAINAAAAQGMAGTAAGMGGANEAYRQTGLAWDERSNQLAQQIAALTMAGQGQYSQFQNQAFGGYMGQLANQQHQTDSNNSMWGSIIGALGNVGGAVAGKGAGGAKP